MKARLLAAVATGLGMAVALLAGAPAAAQPSERICAVFLPDTTMRCGAEVGPLSEVGTTATYAVIAYTTWIDHSYDMRLSTNWSDRASSLKIS